MPKPHLPTDPTTAPSLRSFIEVEPSSHFPIQNLPFGVFAREPGEIGRVGVAIGDRVLDLAELDGAGFLDGTGAEAGQLFDRGALNPLLAAGGTVWRALRRRVSDLLRADSSDLRDDRALRAAALVAVDDVEMRLPAQIGDYTDFYSSRYHAENVGTMMRGPDNALMPNWLHLPVGYHGRSSSVLVGGAPVRRPCGQTMPEGADEPMFGPSRLLDFELEMGFFVGPGNVLGEPIPIEAARDHIFGMVMVNDWSARDIQKWEYVPLGPFLSKSFATSISPWVVTLDALAPFSVPAQRQDPRPLPYLTGGPDAPPGISSAYDIQLEIRLSTERMRARQIDEGTQVGRAGAVGFTIARTSARHLYWTIEQQLAHHTGGGCNVRPGDLMASGTISGPEASERGSLLELTWRGRDPIDLPGGQRRTFLEDGDEVEFVGWCQADGYRVGFGNLPGRILPASC